MDGRYMDVCMYGCYMDVGMVGCYIDGWYVDGCYMDRWVDVWVNGWSDEGILDCFHNPSRQIDLDIDL